MIKFNKYTTSNLLNDGFQVSSDYEIREVLSKMVPNDRFRLDNIANLSKSSDVFRTKLGDIKQIQNLHKNPEFKVDVEFLNKLITKHLNIQEYEILNNQLFCKPPNYKMTSAHQDNAYFESDSDIVTVWIPLQDVDVLNSCMFYVPGSHLDGLVKHNAIGTNVRVRTGSKGVSLYSSYYKNKDFVSVPMDKFDILTHDKNSMHFSSPNLSDDYRISFTAIIKINKRSCDHNKNSKTTTLKDSSYWESDIIEVVNPMTGEIDYDDEGYTVHQNTCLNCGDNFSK